MDVEGLFRPDDNEPTAEELDAEDDYWTSLPPEEHERLWQEREPVKVRPKEPPHPG
jgi:hypothetical protein